MKEWSERFAEQLLRDNLKLEEFQVSLVGFQDFDQIIKRLEDLGCKVTVDRKRLRLTVEVPADKGEKEGLIQKLKRAGGGDPKGEDSLNNFILPDAGAYLVPSGA